MPFLRVLDLRELDTTDPRTVDFVGIDWSAPMSDWRDGNLHRDYATGWTAIYDWDYLKQNIEGGEHFDWTYRSQPARRSQYRSKIEDSAHSEPWVFRLKDIRSWWENTHFNRIDGTRQPGPSGWNPRAKPIHFTSVEILPLDKGTNGARIGETPPFGRNRPDEVVQRAGLEVFLDHWRQRGGEMVQAVVPTYWDARAYPSFPGRRPDRETNQEYWKSPSLSGRTQPGNSYPGENIAAFGFTDAEQPITRFGVTYLPVPVQPITTVDNGSLDKSQISVRLARGTPLDSLFLTFPPRDGAGLTIHQGHVEENPENPLDFPAVWSGRILTADASSTELTLECEPIQSALLRPGLRRRYQITCPLALYGPQCRANRARATVHVTVASVLATTIVLTAPGIPDTHPPRKYAAGLIEWVAPDGGREIRTIVRMVDRQTVEVRGLVRNLAPGAAVSVSLGCNHAVNDCTNLHDNILNYGGQPNIPIENPFSNKNQYY